MHACVLVCMWKGGSGWVKGWAGVDVGVGVGVNVAFNVCMHSMCAYAYHHMHILMCIVHTCIFIFWFACT